MSLVIWFIVGLIIAFFVCGWIAWHFFKMNSNAFINAFVIFTLVVFTSFSLYVLTSYTKQVDVKLDTIDKTLTDLQTNIETKETPQLPSNLTSAKIWEDYYKNRALLMDNIFLVLGLLLPILTGLVGLVVKILTDKKFAEIKAIKESVKELERNVAVEILYLKGLTAMHEADYPVAIHNLKGLLILAPEHYDTTNALGECYHKLSEKSSHKNKEYLQMGLEYDQKYYTLNSSSNNCHNLNLAITISNMIRINTHLIKIESDSKLWENYQNNSKELLEKHKDLLDEYERTTEMEELIQEAEDFIAQQKSQSS